jgi:hypothetical protein
MKKSLLSFNVAKVWDYILDEDKNPVIGIMLHKRLPEDMYIYIYIYRSLQIVGRPYHGEFSLLTGQFRVLK